jgi:hypothetical protein
MTWRTFVQAHWPALVAADFFTTEAWTARGLVTYYTAFVIERHSRRVQMMHERTAQRASIVAMRDIARIDTLGMRPNVNDSVKLLAFRFQEG